MWVFGLGCSGSTVRTFNPCLSSTWFVSDGKLGVDMMTRGYLDPTRFKQSFSTKAAGKYEFFVRRVTYAFLGSIQILVIGVDLETDQFVLAKIGYLRRDSNSYPNLIPTLVNTKSTLPS